VEGSGRGLILRYYPSICLGSEKTHENLSQDSQSPGRDFNPGPPEYEAGVLTARTRRSVKRRIIDLKQMVYVVTIRL
jgi:hypothetical protein